jgi:uncharacterized membrane protein
MELWLGRVLQAGVALAAFFVFTGGVLFLVRHGQEAPAYETFRGEPEPLRRLVGILKEAGAFGGRGLIQLGLLVLIATPVARVAFSLFVFARQRDRMYVGITSVVLVLLLLSLWGGV